MVAQADRRRQVGTSDAAPAAGPALRILLTEDVAADAELELRELRRAGMRVEHRLVDSEPAFRQALAEFVPEVILSDFSMPRFDGMRALAIARELVPDTPFIFVSGTIGEESAIRALHDGASDYVLKTNLVRLPAAIQRAISHSRERAARRSVERELDTARRRLASILASLPDVLWSVELPGDRLAFVSPAAEVLFGHSAEAFLSEPGLWLDVVHPEDRKRVEAAWKAQFDAEPYDIEYRALRPDGSVRWVHDRGHVVLDEEGRPLRVDGIARDISEAMEQRRRIDYLAYYDALTELPNRTLFHDRLTQAIEAARRGGTRLALMVFDIERFKDLNDAYGHAAGDSVLQELALRLRGATPDQGNIARLGSDLFGVLYPAIREPADVARSLATGATRIFDTPFAAAGRELRLAAKSGIAVFPEDGADADLLFGNAEAALKRAKATGERYLFYAPHINARVAEQVDLEGKLRRAVERREFTLHFQPKVDLVGRRIVGAEALIRWTEADGAKVPPMRFIPVLEETGLILPVGRWAIDEAIRTYRGWRERGMAAVPIAVNVSGRQLREKAFVEELRSALGGKPAADCGLDLEITESLLMEDVAGSIRQMREIRALGVGIALDDFGTGYSSLAYLSRLPIDTLKIDRSFIRGMIENPDDTSIATTIISLGQALRMKVVAEGVEDEEQARLLKLLRCDQIQGYLISPPVPLEKFEALLKKPT